MSRVAGTPSRTTCAIGLATVTELDFGGLASGEDQHASRLAGHRAIRALAPSARTIAIEHRAGSPPKVSTGVGTTPIALSLSHCDGRGAAFAAIAPARIGIDLEREDAAAADQARYFLTTREAAALRFHSVVALWALKEAAWKALALTTDIAFHAVELHFRPRGALFAVALSGRRLDASGAVSKPWPGYVLATVRLEVTP